MRDSPTFSLRDKASRRLARQFDHRRAQLSAYEHWLRGNEHPSSSAAISVGQTGTIVSCALPRSLQIACQKYLISEPSAVTDLSEPVAEQRVLTIADTIPTNAGKKRLQQIRRSRPG
jgi:hypothetical protein